MHKMWPEPLKEGKGQSPGQAKNHQVTSSLAELATSATGLRQVLLPFNPASSFSAGVNDPDTVQSQLRRAVNLMHLLPDAKREWKNKRECAFSGHL